MFVCLVETEVLILPPTSCFLFIPHHLHCASYSFSVSYSFILLLFSLHPTSFALCFDITFALNPFLLYYNMPPILTPETAEALATSLDVRPELLQYPVPIETGWCIHCFRVAVREWDETEWVRPFKVNCIRNTVTSKRCQRCFRASDKCELVSILIPRISVSFRCLLNPFLILFRRSTKVSGATVSSCTHCSSGYGSSGSARDLESEKQTMLGWFMIWRLFGPLQRLCEISAPVLIV